MEAFDPGICGSAYSATDPYQDIQNCINWYVESSQNDKSKEQYALLGCPGLGPIAKPGQTAAVRGAWVLPGNTQCLWVIGNQLIVQTMTVPATQNAIAQFSYATVGTLLTNNGPVVIRDNGVSFNNQGGYALIVDGIYGYFYRLAGAGTYSFSAGISNTSTAVTLPGALPSGLIISPQVTVTATDGLVPANTTIASINYASPGITLSAAATGTNASDTLTLNIPAFGQITDPGFPANPSRLAFIEGWLLVNQDGTRQFQTNGPTTYTLMFPGSFYQLKDSSTDNLVTHMEINREWWAIGERTSEVWYNAGGANFAFARIPGVGPQVGCAAKHSIARSGNSLIWLHRSERGENVIVKTNQYGFEAISDKAMSHAIASYPLVSDAIGYVYQEDNHEFYMITFPTADVTWCIDLTENNRPHQRLSFDPTTGTYHRHRSNCYVDFQDLRLVGDYQTGQIHNMNRGYFDDAGSPLRCQRRAPHTWKRADRTRVFQSSLQIEFRPGVGTQTGQGINPQCMLRWSNDGGETWGNEHWLPVGKTGKYKNRAKKNRLGAARDRVYEINFSDPTNRDIIGATLWAETESQQE